MCLEDELGRELPNSILFYRPVRERIYGVLFNLYHHSFLNHRDREKPEQERHALPHVQVSLGMGEGRGEGWAVRLGHSGVVGTFRSVWGGRYV